MGKEGVVSGIYSSFPIKLHESILPIDTPVDDKSSSLQYTPGKGNLGTLLYVCMDIESSLVHASLFDYMQAHSCQGQAYLRPAPLVASFLRIFSIVLISAVLTSPLPNVEMS